MRMVPRHVLQLLRSDVSVWGDNLCDRDEEAALLWMKNEGWCEHRRDKTRPYYKITTLGLAERERDALVAERDRMGWE